MLAAEVKLEIAKLEIMQRTAELAPATEEDDQASFANVDKDEEELKNIEIIIENNAKAEGTTV